MQEKNYQKAAHFLGGSSASCSSVLAKVKAINALQEKIQPALPKQFSNVCRVANMHNGRLVLMVENGAVATQLRYQLPQLLLNLRNELKLHFIREIEIIVRPANVIAPEPTTEKRTITEQTAEIIRSIAAELNHPPLAKILEKIAKHTKG